MKSKQFFIVAILIAIGFVTWQACKDTPAPEPNLSSILKDLKPESYYLNFGNANGAFLDKAQYGSLSEWTNIPAQSVGFKVPGYDRIPIFRLVWPTCPAYGLDEVLAKRIVELAKKSKLQGAEEFSVLNIDGKALITSETSLKALRGYAPDGLDSIAMNGVSLSDVAICPDPPMQKLLRGRRFVYGIPNPSFKDLLGKIQIRPGCKDPRALKQILQNLQVFDKAAFASYQVREIDAQTGILEQIGR